MIQEDVTRIEEAIATLIEMSDKYKTPIGIDIDRTSCEVSVKMCGESNKTQWFSQYKNRSSYIMRAANLLCWLNSKIEKKTNV